MKANKDKCHFLSSLNIAIKLECLIEYSNSEELPGVIIDRKLSFKEHVTKLCNRVSKKIQELLKVFPYIPVTSNE